MSNRIGPHGTALFDAAASDVIHVYSRDSAKVYTKPTGTQVFGLVGTSVDGIELVISALSAAAEVRIEAGGNEVLYNWGVAPAVLDRRGLRGQGAPGALNATGALTAAMILSGLVTSTTAAATVGTVPTGTVMDAALEMEIGESFDWTVVNTGPKVFTVIAAASGHTVVGAGGVDTIISALFRTRKTAAATYITYRLAGGLRGQGAPSALNATGTLTAALMASGIVTSTTGAATVATVDTGTAMDTALPMQVGESFDWAAINTGGNTFTVTAAAGHTLVGIGIVVTATSALFRTRKTAANTFITYKLAGDGA